MRAWITFIALIVTFPTIVNCLCLGGVQQFTLQEGAKKGTEVGTFSDEVVAEGDFDKYNNSLEIINSKTVRLKKDFDPDVDKNLCKLTVPDDITFTVKCTDQTTAQVIIVANFTDDHPPSFDKDQYDVHINEGQPKGTQLLALKEGENVTDNDCGSPTYFYNFESSDGSNNFAITSSKQEVKIMTNSTLDYERKNKYQLNFTVQSKFASSSSYKRTHTTVEVIVDDVDDRYPIFTNTTFHLSVPEQTELGDEWLVTTPAIHAYDGDIGINTTILYTITNTKPSLEVKINDTDGRIKIKSTLDREQTSSYQIHIKASQRDKTYKSVLAQLILRVEDVNDNLPQFSNTTYNVTVLENAPVGTWVLPLRVKDDDIGDNSTNTISIDRDDLAAFDLKHSTKDGVTWLVVKDTNSLLGKSSGLLEIRATNTTPLFGNLTCDSKTTCVMKVIVTVQDVNDHKPKFNKSQYNFEMFRPKQDQTVGTISASDDDRGDNAKVTLTISSVRPNTQPCKDAFRLDSDTGEINMTKDINQSDLCFLNVLACDNPTNADDQLCAVMLIIIRLNYIKPSYDLNLDENVPIGKVVLELPINGLKVNNSAFTIDSNNRLVTNHSIDRETIPKYNLQLTKDLKSVSKVTVCVNDLNDNAPIPEPKNYNISLTGFEIDGTPLTAVQAKDIDKGENARLSYYLINNRNWLAINETTGHMVLTKMPLNNHGRMFQTFVEIQDNGSPPLKSVAVLRISFNEINGTINSTSLILPLTRSEVIRRWNEIEKELSSFIEYNVTIFDVKSLGEVEQLGSELFLKAKSVNGTAVSPVILKRLLKEKAEEIYQLFKKQKDDNDDDNDNDDDADDDDDPLFKTLFIIFVCLCVLFIIISFVIWRYYRSQTDRKKKQLSVMRSLNRDTKIYDDTNWKDDTLPLHENGGGSVIRVNGISSHHNSSDEINYLNPVYSGYDDEINRQTVLANGNAIERSISGFENQHDIGDSPRNTKHDNEEENSPAGNTGENMDNNWFFTNRNNIQDSHTSEHASESESSPYDNVNMGPFVSTINIEKPQNVSKTIYTNVAVDDLSNDIKSQSPNAIVGGNPVDCDNSFPRDKDGQEEEEDVDPGRHDKTRSDDNDRLNTSQCESRSTDDDGIDDNDAPVEPEPDYAKKVHFDHFRRQIQGESFSEMQHRESREAENVSNGIPPNTFYFADQTVTAL